MNKTADVIASLSAETKPTKKMAAPGFWIVRLLMVLAIYATACQLYLGLRADVTEQFTTRLLFALEILSLSLLLISSAIASILAMYPDAYQKPQLMKLPLCCFFYAGGVGRLPAMDAA